MQRPVPALLAAGLAAVTLAGAIPRAAAAQAPAAVAARPTYTAADVRFLSGMIGHHAQAVLMAGWAPSHGASPSLRILAERIVVSQRDEIAFMQRWLREHGQPVPEADASHELMPGMEGMHHETMPGMLTAEQLAQLSAATGAEFDRLFLTFMIRHHEGALTMVDQLFASPGAGQDDVVFKFASDVSADQTAEIDRMSQMLGALGTRRP